MLQTHQNALKNSQNVSFFSDSDNDAATSLENAARSVTASDGNSINAVTEALSMQQPSTRHILSWPEESGKSFYLREETPDLPPLTIPPAHEASSSCLLDLPQVRNLAGNFPGEFFFRVEAHPSRILQHQMTDASTAVLHHITRDTGDELVDRYFEAVNPFHPVLDRNSFEALYEETMKTSLQNNDVSAVILLVLALGAIMKDAPQGQSGSEDTTRSLGYYSLAQKILLSSWAHGAGETLLLSQGLFLCALYLTYMVRPLLAWRFIYLASTSVEQLLIR